MSTPTATLEQLNRECLCLSLDRDALARSLDAELGQPGLSELVRERCPFVFAAQPVFVAAPRIRRMAQVVRAVESVVALPAYLELTLAAAPAIARLGTAGPRGVFFGYDFHLEQDRVGLIEINTNAGGAMLNAVLARAQRACCEAMDSMVPTRASAAAFEQRIVDMFRQEWRLAGHSRPLASIAIVDSAPPEQYLYAEFLLFQELFERHGLRAVIADPRFLEWRDGRLWHGNLAIDLVYNRLTDFYLEQPESAALREAYVHQGVVLTPHPQAHALYADKRHLALLSDDARLRALGVPKETRQVLLDAVPHTELVHAADGERLWAARRGLFFKPVAGFGSRAAYRGDKLTRRVWQEILAGDYVAQAIVPPGERLIDDDSAHAMKFDLRAYAYNGEAQWVAARMYRGQATNFRTPGGGFAPVYSTVDASGRALRRPGGEHASYVFLLDEAGAVHAVPHGLYVALARHEAAAPAWAGQSLRLADWYVRLKDGEPDSIVNETYGLARVDEQGLIQSVTAPADAGWPTSEERERMHAMLFAGAESVV
ncbi:MULTISPECIES: hypothetical protein [unclassified Variovorax]|uniref:hypothetical protein n=1 Tax=unclassified Variovorax TaxID=663243 RepID=UPI00076C53A6|nr:MULTISPECIES: hypothetical protein [unclassified Variovorax]KWT94149.1 hypothetical protein APY03_2745 [Variovorax sp. WDL1]PNG59892.1 hypothetical protein CHC07_01621 [Variovorax sp. B4]PNG60317.1 hypothetical protein CHC06_00214 [Variovorax sp. B2]VTV13831.1 hypothetical protein WDL1CHR_04457 [Variovorax sp. WDL1]